MTLCQTLCQTESKPSQNGSSWSPEPAVTRLYGSIEQERSTRGWGRLPEGDDLRCWRIWEKVGKPKNKRLEHMVLSELWEMKLWVGERSGLRSWKVLCTILKRVSFCSEGYCINYVLLLNNYASINLVDENNSYLTHDFVIWQSGLGSVVLAKIKR